MDIRPHSDFDARRGTGPRPTVSTSRRALQARLPVTCGQVLVPGRVFGCLNQDFQDFQDEGSLVVGNLFPGRRDLPVAMSTGSL